MAGENSKASSEDSKRPTSWNIYKTIIDYHQLPNLGAILKGDLVSKIRNVIGLKDIINCECNCNSATKLKGKYAYGYECRACCVVDKVTWKIFLLVYMVSTQKHPQK